MKVRQSLEISSEGNEYIRAVRQKIDDDIDELAHRIRSLKAKRNELAPVSVLPPEVLSSIFVLVRDLSIYTPFIGYRSSNQLASWIHVGHICRHWREIALNCPSLWSVPVLARPNLSQDMMQRSKMVPLTIIWTTGVWSSKAVEQLENALTQATRIKSIELALGHYPQRPEGPFSLLSQSTPLLESLLLSDDSPYNNYISFPPDILSNAPRLGSVNFDGVKISWESAIFKHRSLTDLQLTDSLSGASTTGQMMDTLHHLPNLRILVLTHSIPPYTASDGNTRTIKFKFLERLEVSAKAVDCVPLLRHIQYPSPTTVKLRSYQTSVEDGMTIISLLGQNLCYIQDIEAGIDHSPAVIQSARLTSCYNEIEITFSNSVDNTSELYGTGGLDPIVRINLCDGTGYLNQAHDRLLTSVSNSYNLFSLKDLLLGWSFTSDHIPIIQEFLGKLPDIKAINISRSFPEICTILTATGSGEKPKINPTHDPPQSRGTSQLSSSPVILLPALETLTVRSVHFKRRQRRHSGILNQLIDMLIKRSNDNMPIDNLSLEDCYRVRVWQAELLGELVVQLKIDGKVTELDSKYGYSDQGDSSDEDDEDEDESEYSDDGSP